LAQQSSREATRKALVLQHIAESMHAKPLTSQTPACKPLLWHSQILPQTLKANWGHAWCTAVQI
jgi:hypothetical protein